MTMKMKYHYLFFLNLLILPIDNTIASEPEGAGVFVLDVDTTDLRGLARRITGEIQEELNRIKERMLRKVKEDLDRYKQFELDITDKNAITEDYFDSDKLKRIAKKNFPAVYPKYIEIESVQKAHPVLWYIFKSTNLKKPVFIAGKENFPENLSEKEIERYQKRIELSQRKFNSARQAFYNALKRTKEQFNSTIKAVEAITIFPTSKLHITLCECVSTGCSTADLKYFFTKFYDTPTQCVAFSIDTIGVYPEGQGWIVLKVTSRYIDELIQKLQQEKIFKCNVRTPYHAHISILRFNNLKGPSKTMILQQLREFLLREEDVLLGGFKADYYINIRKFGIQRRVIKYLHTM